MEAHEMTEAAWQAEEARERAIFAAGERFEQARIRKKLLAELIPQKSDGSEVISVAEFREALDRACPPQETTSPSTTSS